MQRYRNPNKILFNSFQLKHLNRITIIICSTSQCETYQDDCKTNDQCTDLLLSTVPFVSLFVCVCDPAYAGLPFPMPDPGLKYFNEIASVQQQQSSSVQPFSFPYTTSSPLPYFQMPSGKNTEVTQLHTVQKKMAK